MNVGLVLWYYSCDDRRSDQGCVWICRATSALADISRVCQYLQGNASSSYTCFKRISYQVVHFACSLLCFQEEEEERSNRWKEFLESQGVSDNVPAAEGSEIASSIAAPTGLVDDRGNIENEESFGHEEGYVQMEQVEYEKMMHKTQSWSQIRPSLVLIEQWMSARVKKKAYASIGKPDAERSANGIVQSQESKPLEDSEDEFYDVERSDVNQDVSSGYGSGTDSAVNVTNQGALPESSVPWKEELEFLVSGGLPMALRGEVALNP